MKKKWIFLLIIMSSELRNILIKFNYLYHRIQHNHLIINTLQISRLYLEVGYAINNKSMS